MAYRESYLEIDLTNIAYNINSYHNKLNKDIFAVIKANAYGLGDVEIAKVAIENNVKYLCVSSLDEAMSLRNNNIYFPILVLGYVNEEHLEIAKNYDITVSVTSLDWLEKSYLKLNGIKVHIKINTGMNRLGLNSIEEVKRAMKLLRNAEVEGIYSHLVISDQKDNIMNEKQIAKFKSIYTEVDHCFKYVHIANSDAVFVDDSIFNAARIGIGLFGYSSDNKDIKSTVSLKTKVVNIQKCKKDDTIGYGMTYILNQDNYIATLPIGYADGVLPNHQNETVYIGSNQAKIVGRICMDMMMIEVDRYYPLNTEVELFGENINLKEYAKRVNVIPYVILVTLSERLMKKYYKKGEMVACKAPRFER